MRRCYGISSLWNPPAKNRFQISCYLGTRNLAQSLKVTKKVAFEFNCIPSVCNLHFSTYNFAPKMAKIRLVECDAYLLKNHSFLNL